MSVSILEMLNDPQALPQAALVRQQVWGKKIFVRGIIEFSNHCRQNCLYCGLRRDNTGLMRYCLQKKQILDAARQIKKLGMGTVVLQSGEDPGYDKDFISDLVKAIKNELGLAVTLSLGERSNHELKAWRTAGADRYLLKLETFTQPLYSRLRPGCALEKRMQCLEDIRQAGYETGSGIITGLPWQGRNQQADDLAQLLELQLDMVSLSPFCPHPQTPLGAYPAHEPQQNLQALAIVRRFMPQAHIPVTSALALHGDEIKLQALHTACNVLMLSLTPQDVRSAYNIYPGKNLSPMSPQTRARVALKHLLKNGFTLPDGPGGAWRLEHNHE